MLKSVVREYKFTPSDIDKLYLDDIDYHGLVYWYNDVLQIQKDLKSK
jgi:hypothetical protein